MLIDRKLSDAVAHCTDAQASQLIVEGCAAAIVHAGVTSPLALDAMTRLRTEARDAKLAKKLGREMARLDHDRHRVHEARVFSALHTALAPHRTAQERADDVLDELWSVVGMDFVRGLVARVIAP
jgi:hypothetical protein